MKPSSAKSIITSAGNLLRHRQADVKRRRSVIFVTLRRAPLACRIDAGKFVPFSGGAMAAILTCAHCGGDLESGDRYCPQCGAESLACPSCARALLATDLSCPHCGTPAESTLL